jgi:hypothetical protein
VAEGEQDKLEDKQKEHDNQSKPLGKVVHAEPLQNRPLSEALGKLPEMDLKK